MAPLWLLATLLAALLAIQPAHAFVKLGAEVDLAKWSNGTFDAGAIARALVPRADFLRFNAALNNVRFGPNPGPCPNLANACTTNFASLPSWIRDAPVTIEGKTRPLSYWVERGDFALWDFRCDDLEVDFIAVSRSADVPHSGGQLRSPMEMDIDDLKLNCYGKTRVTNMRVKGRYCPVRVFGSCVGWREDTVNAAGTADAVLNKGQMGGENNGVVVNTAFNVFRPNVPTAAMTAPTQMVFQSGREGCFISISRGFSLQNDNIDISGGILVTILSWLFPNLVRGIMRDVTRSLIEGVMCGVLRGAAVTSSGQPGPVNEFLTSMRNDLNGWKAGGRRGPSQFSTDDFIQPLVLPNVGPSSSWTNFRTDELFEAISVGLNNYLGADSLEPGYLGRPVINEVVDVLNGDTTGVLDLPNIRTTFQLSEVPTFDFGEDLTRNTMSLKGVKLRGINTFNTFELLNNSFGGPPGATRYTRTVTSAIDMDSFTLELIWDMEMRPGAWVTAGGRTERFTFSMQADFTNLRISAATLLLLQQNKLLQLQLGQLAGDTQTYTNRFNCALRAVDHFRFSGLQASAGSVSLNVVNFFDLESLLVNIVSIANYFYQPIIERDLPEIMDNFARIEANDYLDNTFFLQALPACPGYAAPLLTGDARFFNLTENLGQDFVANLVDNLIGGDPITRNSVDINSLIAATLRYLIFDRTEGAINNDPLSVYTFDNPSDGVWQVRETIDVFSSVNSSTSRDTLRIEVKGPRVTDLNSIHRFVITNSTSSDYRFGFDFTWGNGPINQQNGPQVTVPFLGFELPVAIDTNVNGFVWANEDFTFRLQLQLDFSGEIEAEIFKNEVYLSRIEDLLSLSCALATLNSKALTGFQINLVNFSFGMVFVGDGQFAFSDSPVGVALEAWRVRLTSAQALITTEYFLNFIIDRIQNETIKIFNEDFVPPYTRAQCLTQVSPLNGTLFDSPLPQPNITAINEFLKEATKFQPIPFGEEASVWEKRLTNNERAFDLTAEENLFVDALSSGITPTSIRNVLLDVAATQPDPQNPSVLDPLYRILFLEPGNVTTLRLDPNTITSVNFEPDTEGLIPGLKFRATQVELTNLQSFADINLLQPYVSSTNTEAKFTTYNTLDYGNNSLKLTLSFEVEVGAIVFDPLAVNGEILKDTIDIELNLTGVDVTALMAVAVDQEALGEARLGEIVFFNETTHAFQVRPDAYNCTIKRIMFEEGIYFPQLQANLTSVEGPKIDITTNFFGEEAKNVIQVMVEMFVAVFTKQVPNLTQGALRKEVNIIFAEIIADAKKESAEVCTGVQYPTYAESRGVRTFNFTRSAFGPDMQAFIDVDLLNPNSQLNINALINRFVADVDFFDNLLDNILEENDQLLLGGKDYGNSTLKFGGIRIEGLGSGGIDDASITELSILDNVPFGAAQPYTTQTRFKTVGKFEMSVNLKYSFNELFVGPALGAGSDGRRALEASYPVQNDIRIGIELSGIDVLANLTTRADINNILDLTAGSVLDIYKTPSNAFCILSIFEDEGLVIEGFAFTTEFLRLTLRCEGVCTSPMLAPLNQAAVATGAGESQDLTDGFNSFFQLVAALSGQATVQDVLDQAVDISRTECNFDFELAASVDEPLTDAASLMGYAGLGVVGGALMGAFFLIPTHKKRRNQIMVIAFGRLNGKDGQLALKGEHLLLIERKLKSCFRHPAVPRVAKFLAPALTVVAMAMFLAANLNTVGARVDITISAAGDVTQPVGILEFTLASSINDMWNSGTYFLAFIIFLASGAWPHTKSALMLFAWFAPPTVLAHKRRGYMLEVLDALGKWSLIDAYVLIMLQVAFRFYLTSSYVSQLDFLTPDAFTIDVLVVPGPSIYLFVLATMLALVVSHWMVYHHRRIMASDEAIEDAVNGVEKPQLVNVKRAVMRHVFLVPDQRNILYGFSSGTKLAAGSLLGFSAVLVAIGSFLPMITFVYGGVMGTVIGFVRPDLQTRTYSAVSIALAIRDGIPADDGATQAGVVFLQMVYLVFTLLTPLALLALLAVLWFRPLTAGDQKRLLFITEIVAAWEALLVLLVAILAAATEVSQLAQFIINVAVGDLCESVVAPLLVLGVSEADATCFNVSATVEGSGAILIAGSILTVIAAAYMFRLITPVVQDRHLQRMGRLNQTGQCPRLVVGNWPNELVLRNAVRPVSRIRTTPAGDPAFADDDGYAEAGGASASMSSFNPGFKADIDV